MTAFAWSEQCGELRVGSADAVNTLDMYMCNDASFRFYLASYHLYHLPLKGGVSTESAQLPGCTSLNHRLEARYLDRCGA